MNEVLWSDHHHAKYAIGDLVYLIEMVKERGGTDEQLAPLRKQLRCAVAFARSIADQRNAELRDEPEVR